jgi:predicted dehydrogenase
MNSPLQFAIIGCGKIAPRHAMEAAKLGKLVAVCDIIPGRADSLAKEYESNAYYNINDLLDKETEIDLLAVCTPNGLHAAHSIQALGSGANVLCEKPLSITVSDAKLMIDAAKKKRTEIGLW